MHLITAWDMAEKYLRRADKNRKIYNGMMKTYFYSYNARPVSAPRPKDGEKKPAANQGRK